MPMMRLVTFDHCCLSVDGCGVKVLERALNGGGRTRKLLLGIPGQGGVFARSIDDAIRRAKRAGCEISQEDIKECQRLIS